MYFLVYERRKGSDEEINDLGGLVSGITEWLGHLQQMMKRGKVVHHWGFRGQHGSVTIYDVASGEELQEILHKNPMDEKWVHREIYPVCTLEQEINNVSNYMTGI
jgi:muconolactone delta-isomerase